MNDSLEKAFKKASLLPEKDKDLFAAFIMEELEHEERWQQLVEKSSGVLKDMANEAISEYKKGKTKPLNPEDL